MDGFEDYYQKEILQVPTTGSASTTTSKRTPKK
jgi:hypothetical protein